MTTDILKQKWYAVPPYTGASDTHSSNWIILARNGEQIIHEGDGDVIEYIVELHNKELEAVK